MDYQEIGLKLANGETVNSLGLDPAIFTPGAVEDFKRSKDILEFDLGNKKNNRTKEEVFREALDKFMKPYQQLRETFTTEEQLDLHIALLEGFGEVTKLLNMDTKRYRIMANAFQRIITNSAKSKNSIFSDPEIVKIILQKVL